VLSGQEHRVARLTVVGRHSHGGTGMVRGDQPRHRLRSHQRLVRQRHHRCADVGRQRLRRLVRLSRLPTLSAVQGAEGDAERGAHAGPPLGVVHGTCSAQLDRGGTGDDEDWVRAAGPQQRHAALGEGLAVQFDERLGPAEPGPLSRGEKHSRD
jgi:hypothetical protein